MDKFLNAKVETLFFEESKKRGVVKYADILEAFPLVNAATDTAFQKKFNGFYRVRRNTDWQKVYYEIMERGKTTPLSFESVVCEIYQKLGRVEASFTSKLLHTLNNDMPIWDRFVLQNLGLKMPVCESEKKLKLASEIYNEIVKWYKSALSDEKINQKLLEFDEFFPEYKHFSKTKKLDFFLWQIRD